MSTVGNNTAFDAIHEPGETPAAIDTFLRGVADEVALACAPDVLIDVNVPTWRSQLKGRDALRHILTEQEFLPEGTVVTWRSTTTADGHLLEAETHAPIEGKQRKWRQVVRVRGGSVRWLRRGLAGPDTWGGLAAGCPRPSPCRASCGLRRR